MGSLFDWQEGESEVDFTPMPEVLTHPNIPKPLHGLNPRVLKGRQWWDVTRKKAYESTGFRCIACGIPKSEANGPKWLEGHEYWNIDYQKGVCEVEKIVPLCHWCHAFIHSGRLLMIAGKDKSHSECREILEHGFRILKKHGLKCFFGTLRVATELKARTFGVEASELDFNPGIQWKDWKLILEGKEYHSKFADEYEWANHYKRG